MIMAAIAIMLLMMVVIVVMIAPRPVHMARHRGAARSRWQR
jgi:hypothetical protein